MPSTLVIAVTLAAAVLFAATVVYTWIERRRESRRPGRRSYLATPESLAAVGARRPAPPVARRADPGTDPVMGDLLRQAFVATLIFAVFIGILTWVDTSSTQGAVQGRTGAPETPADGPAVSASPAPPAASPSALP